MKIAIISFTEHGHILAEKIGEGLAALDYEVFAASFKQVGEIFESVQGIVFIGASGIAVRGIAPYIKSKYTDPAVVVCDDFGGFAISLLSGHEGGANDLTRVIARIIDAVPVVTTATEVEAAALLPRNIVVGFGCRRGTSAAQIAAAFDSVKIDAEQILKICTVDLKANEAGLLKFAWSRGIPLVCYTPEQLASVSGEFSASEFVKEITGVDNICERAAVLGAGSMDLMLSKTVFDGVTIASVKLTEKEPM